MHTIISVGLPDSTRKLLSMHFIVLPVSVAHLLGGRLDWRESNPTAIVAGDIPEFTPYLIAHLRECGISLPIIKLHGTDRNDVWVRQCVDVLDAGGDDLLLASASGAEIEWSIRRVIRLSKRCLTPCIVFKSGSSVLEINKRLNRIQLNGHPISGLTGREQEVLWELGTSGRTLSRNEIGDRLGMGDFNSLEVLIHRIRHKLGSAASMLRTVRGTGYTLSTTH